MNFAVLTDESGTDEHGDREGGALESDPGEHDERPYEKCRATPERVGGKRGKWHGLYRGV